MDGPTARPKAGTLIFSTILRFYHEWASPALHSISSIPGGCKFVPSCSEYAAEAIEQHGLIRGGGLAAWRLLRCHPFSRGGFDPVPAPCIHPKREGRDHLS